MIKLAVLEWRLRATGRLLWERHISQTSMPDIANMCQNETGAYILT
jgi:hypothetical protein